MNLIHSSAICCSATLLPLRISCLFANCFDRIGEELSNFSGLGCWEGFGAAPGHSQAFAGLSRATGQTLAPGHEGATAARVSGGEGDSRPPAMPFLPRIRSLLARHLGAAGWIVFGCFCGKEQYFESLLWLV